MVLKEMVAVNPSLVFKGGTALSKCYGAIDRFSEDVDFGLETEQPTSGMRRATKKAVQHAVSVLGLTIANADETKSRRRYNQYIIPLPQLVDDTRSDTLIIETGLITSASPSREGKAISFVGEYLVSMGAERPISDYGLMSFSTKVITLERALADKLFALADYYLREDTLDRQSRHLYDIQTH